MIFINNSNMSWEELDAKGIHIVNCWIYWFKESVWDIKIIGFTWFRGRNKGMKWCISLFNFNIYYSI